MSFWPRVLAIVIVLSLPAPSARAEEPEDLASAALAKGKALFDQRRYQESLVELELSHRLRAHFATRCSIATSLEKLGRVVEAAGHYRRCLREGAEGSLFEAEAKASLRRVEARITWLSIGERALVFLDGAAVGNAPGRIQINPGSHVVELRGRAGSRTLTIQTSGGERLQLGEGPATMPALGLQARLPDLPVPPRRSRRRLTPALFWTAVSITAGLVTASAVLSAQTVARRSEYESRPTREAYESFTNLRLATNIFWSFAAAAAGSSTVLFFYTDFGAGRDGHERRAMVGGRVSF